MEATRLEPTLGLVAAGRTGRGCQACPRPEAGLPGADLIRALKTGGALASIQQCDLGPGRGVVWGLGVVHAVGVASAVEV